MRCGREGLDLKSVRTVGRPSRPGWGRGLEENKGPEDKVGTSYYVTPLLGGGEGRGWAVDEGDTTLESTSPPKPPGET